MNILTIDTATNVCACRIDRSTGEYVSIIEYIERGHAEKLIPQIAALFEKAKFKLENLDAIAVNTGPSSFTGIRIGVSASRALSLALEIPSFGINIFTILAFLAKQKIKNIYYDNLLVITKAYANYYNVINFLKCEIEKEIDICTVAASKIPSTISQEDLLQKLSTKNTYCIYHKQSQGGFIDSQKQLCKKFIMFDEEDILANIAKLTRLNYDKVSRNTQIFSPAFTNPASAYYISEYQLPNKTIKS